MDSELGLAFGEARKSAHLRDLACQGLSNEFFLAIVGFDTAENELPYAISAIRTGRRRERGHRLT